MISLFYYKTTLCLLYSSISLSHRNFWGFSINVNLGFYKLLLDYFTCMKTVGKFPKISNIVGNCRGGT